MRGLKIQTAHRVGFKEVQDSQPVDISEEDLLALIDKYNNDESINGILVQLPLPKHIDDKKVLNAIDPDKDVDGFHPVNVGRLMIGGDEVKFPPCTPAGIQEMIVRAGVETSGAEVVVVPVRDEHHITALDDLRPDGRQRMTEPGVDEDARASLALDVHGGVAVPGETEAQVLAHRSPPVVRDGYSSILATRGH